MNHTTQIDETDATIIRTLLKDARTPLKDIAKKCGISSVSILNRIKRLKQMGVINGGATLFPVLDQLKIPIVATVGINLKSNFEEVIQTVQKNINTIQISSSVGKYDLIAAIHAESINELDKISFSIKRLPGVQKVEINVWTSMPFMAFENIDCQPKEEKR
ncbi:MAG: Lrp/AsnC family transcriptional regulator [Candidatus Bathyarchaeota archaeon]|nr:Lrp/AsnC family transcriptional regulator [Candidatus Bathyarchaeota archaeon]